MDFFKCCCKPQQGDSFTKDAQEAFFCVYSKMIEANERLQEQEKLANAKRTLENVEESKPDPEILAKAEGSLTAALIQLDVVREASTEIAGRLVLATYGCDREEEGNASKKGNHHSLPGSSIE